MALQYRGIDIMGWTKDTLDNPVGQTQIDAHIDQLTRDYPTLNLIATSIPMNTNAQAMAARGSNFAIEPATYAARFNNKIHANACGGIFRGTDCAFEGIYSFSKASKRNGSKYSFFGDPITDSFSSVALRNHGYSLTSSSGNIATNYLTSHQTGNTWTIVDGELTGPSADAWKRSCFFNAPNLRDVTMVAKVKKVGHQQIIVRGSTDNNFPGYGLQMRDTNVLRIERPGLASLGSVTKTWVTGQYYWLKLQAIGTAIKGKSWAVGEEEPTTGGESGNNNGWDIEVTDGTYTNGYCGFSGESNAGKFDDMTITPEIDTDTWMYRGAGWIRDNIALFATGDQVVPFPEASSHQALTNQGSYNQFFMDLQYCIERIGTENGKTLQAGFFSHLWTTSVQGSHNTQFNVSGVATYDHYGTALGLGKRFGSFNHGSVGAANTYTVPTSITESATTRHDFIPEKICLNKEIDVYVVEKGTGDLKMTIHKGNNDPVQMADVHDISDLTNSYEYTILNASITEGAMNIFPIDWVNLDNDTTYHYHLTQSTGDATIKCTTADNLNTAYTNGYKYAATADALELDIRKTHLRTGGIPQYLQEWGDFWSTDSSRSTPTRTQGQHEAYLDEIYAALQRLVDDGILIGFNYWRAVGGHEGIISDIDATAGYNFQMLYEGVRLKNFFDNSGTPTRSRLVASSRSSSSSRTSSSNRTISTARVAS